jgi:hypothetical protein
MRLAASLVLTVILLLSACSNVNYSKGFVRAIELEPRETIAGVTVRVLVELYDPYIYPGIEGAGPRLTLQVDGGTLEGRQWVDTAIDGGYEVVNGPTLTGVAPHLAIFWTLPTEPGTYKLDVSFDGDTRTKRVEIE